MVAPCGIQPAASSSALDDKRNVFLVVIACTRSDGFVRSYETCTECREPLVQVSVCGVAGAFPRPEFVR